MGDVAVPIWLLLIWLLLPLVYLIAFLVWAPRRAAERWVQRFSGDGADTLRGLIEPAVEPMLDALHHDISDDVVVITKKLIPEIIAGGVGKFAETVKKDSPAAAAVLDLADAPWWQQLGAQIIGLRMGGLGGLLGGGAGEERPKSEGSSGFKPGL